MDRHRSNRQEIVDGYSGIFSQLRKAPKDIEEVASMREPLGRQKPWWGPLWKAPPVMVIDGLDGYRWFIKPRFIL